MRPKVSIIIPVYNAEPYLEECLNSILNQTFKEIEILCIDDCSMDRSIEKIRHMAHSDSRITLIQNERNLGAGETRNRGIELVKGEFFFFWMQMISWRMMHLRSYIVMPNRRNFNFVSALTSIILMRIKVRERVRIQPMFS